MKLNRTLLIAIICIMNSLGYRYAISSERYPEAAEKQRLMRQKFAERQVRELEIYARMAKEGITREAADAIGALGSTIPVSTRDGRVTPDALYSIMKAEKVLKPGDSYRFELDNHVLTMLVPDEKYMQSWIVPYADTRTEQERSQVLRDSSAGLEVANLGWFIGIGIWPFFFGWEGIMTTGIRYRSAFSDSKDGDVSTPENLRAYAQEVLETFVPSQAEIDDAIRSHAILNRAGNRIYLNAQPVVINGRIWIRTALNSGTGRRYAYQTAFVPDRTLLVTFGMPQYDYNANPDISTYPSALKRAFARMEAMVASMRIVKKNDDGSPDPYVVKEEGSVPGP